MISSSCKITGDQFLSIIFVVQITNLVETI